MSDFEIREIPAKATRKSGKWALIADAIKANRGKAIFVASNGHKPGSIRASGAASFARLNLKNVHSTTAADGVYFWLNENGA